MENSDLFFASHHPPPKETKSKEQDVGPEAGAALWFPEVNAFCWVPNAKGTKAMRLGWHKIGFRGHFKSSQHQPRGSEHGERTLAVPDHLQPSSTFLLLLSYSEHQYFHAYVGIPLAHRAI